MVGILPAERKLSPIDIQNLDIAFDQGTLAQSLDEACKQVYQSPDAVLNPANIPLPHLSLLWDELAGTVDDLSESYARLKTNKIIDVLLGDLAQPQNFSAEEVTEMKFELQSMSGKQPYKLLFDDYLDHFNVLKIHYRNFGEKACDTINQLPVSAEIKSAHLDRISDDLKSIDQVVIPYLLHINTNTDQQLLQDSYNNNAKGARAGLVITENNKPHPEQQSNQLGQP